jgi:pilus assembly protein CpaB
MGAFGKFLILVAFLGAAAAFAVFYGAPQPWVSAAAPQTRMVRVAAEPRRVGAFLDNARAPLAPKRIDAPPQGAVTEEHGMLGAVIVAEAPEGAIVTRAALLRPGQEGFLAAVLKPGLRAVSIAVDAVTGDAGHILPGDRVDVLLTQRVDLAAAAGASDPGLLWASETILRDARVIAVHQRLDADIANRGAEGQPATAVARTITVEVSPEGAETISVARNLGALSLTLRSLIVDGASADAAAPETRDGPAWARDVSAATCAASMVVEPTPPEARAETACPAP